MSSWRQYLSRWKESASTAPPEGPAPQEGSSDSRPRPALIQQLTSTATLPPALRAGLERYRTTLLQLETHSGASYRAGTLEAAQSELAQLTLPTSLGATILALDELFRDCQDIVYRAFLVGGCRPALLLHVDGMTEVNRLEQAVLKSLTRNAIPENLQPGSEPFRLWLEAVALSVDSPDPVESIGQVVDDVLAGATVLLIDGVAFGLTLPLPSWKTRAIEEPPSERVIRGPREGFTETLQTNTMLVRRRIKTPHLKTEQLTIGRRTKTQLALLYLKDVASPALVGEVRSRLKRIEIDGVIDSGMLEELIEDQPFSIFPQVGNTERPDRVAASLLEGRVAILVDGSPHALLAPVTFWVFMQSSEDYYERFWMATFLRWLRYLFLVIALLGPSAYVAVSTFHQEMLPTALLLSIAAAREGVPFPALVETFLMELFFEALREAGVRLPQPVGQAVSIVGALVIGQAAVQAGLASAPVVIIVAATGIASFVIPRYTLSIPIRLLRFPMILLAGSLGLFGIMVGMTAVLVHLCALRSFGAPYLEPLAPSLWGGLKDVLIRAPIWLMGRRPQQWHPVNLRRQARWLKPGPGGRGE